MRSLLVEKFNHDEDADGYDVDVLDEANPIRAGYDKLLTWMVEQAPTTGDTRVLDLGAGTGNLGLRLPCFKELACVDVSEKMTTIGKRKLSGRSGISWVLVDLLEFFDEPPDPFDIVLSSYSIHHLTADEKTTVFEEIRDALVPGGRAIFGDLMFESEKARRALMDQYIGIGEEEFFWNLEETLGVMADLGLETDFRRFSDLSWGVLAKKPA